ncbi:hypothetical protein [Zongyangia hominis]|uniref:Transmembrane protein n=1 Tax=Zongyangia hominis TaxID=2763677 RepID=A0A926IBA8_9FIRM|nr:hypothetical protein [Zongyangia hominis]MBC8571051.1 hypothetical protein [Zongyangia hominis]
MSCETCPNEDRIKALEGDSERNQKTHKEFFSRFEEMKVEAKGIQKDFQNILSVLNEVKSDVKELKDKPGKRWESVVNLLLQWAVLGLLAATMIFR